LISTTVLGSTVSILISDLPSNDASKIRIVFQSNNADLLLQLKSELLQEKCSDVASSGKGLIPIPFELIRQLDDLRSLVDSIDDEASEENFCALEVCYSYLREHISTKLP
jgi:hypothetical protein